MSAPISERRFLATRQPTCDDHVRGLLMQEYGRAFTLLEVASTVYGTKAPNADQVAEIYAALGRLIAAGCVRTKGGA